MDCQAKLQVTSSKTGQQAGTKSAASAPGPLRDRYAGSQAAEWQAGAGRPPPPPTSNGGGTAARQATKGRFGLWAGVLTTVLLVALIAVTILVLWRSGIIFGRSGDDWEPLPYAPRVRVAAAEPAFQADLHPWLRTTEQAALGLQLDADVIVIGAGVAGLKVGW